jgi:tRNA A-37 threonylcarbamoyl transferase component Bud32
MALTTGVSRIGNYVFEKCLGTGAFAEVWLASHQSTLLKVAIKVILKSSIVDPEAMTRFARELNFLKQMRHSFISEFFECLEDDHAFYCCMEFAENDTLLKFMLQNGPLPESQARHFFSQLVCVLEYLHVDLCVCHRDVKAENLLLDRHNNIRVIDFGLSNQFNANHPVLNTACGSPPYAPPEMIKRQPYTQAADIWSAGVLLYSMATGTLPFDDENVTTLLRKIVTQEVPYPSYLSRPLSDLLQRMLTKNPEMRITLDEIKNHEWFSQSQYAALFAMNLSERATEVIVDSDLVDQMAQMGIETATLRQQLLLGAFTELTAMYRMLRRQRLTDQMMDLVASLPGTRITLGPRVHSVLPNAQHIPRGMQIPTMRPKVSKKKGAALSPVPIQFYAPRAPTPPPMTALRSGEGKVQRIGLLVAERRRRTSHVAAERASLQPADPPLDDAALNCS